ncbi:MAG TPA: GDSL-type esterase/lipase family protein [Gaiellaceae bacterium]|nr:GDSL-type esterase/lipase family protein [Gaiellaceae bacterium]
MAGRLGVLALAALLAAVTLWTASAAAPAADTSVWHVVALGDSDTSGSGDPTGLGWAGRYARLLRTRLGLKVVFTNLAQEGKTSDVLLSELRSDPATRATVKKAQIVLVGIGGADLNAGDTRNEAKTCKGTACYAADLRAFGRNLDLTAAAIRKLRKPGDAVLRAITLPNVVPGAAKLIPPFITPAIGIYQTTTLKMHICAAMARHGGRCIDALGAFNGPTATQNAYATGLLEKTECCYPSGKGQQLMAELVLKTGLAPLR